MASSPRKQDWMKEKWRPAMGWVYMATCITDFIIFPVLWSILQAIQGGQVTSQWNPITLQGAGLFHLAMGAVLGVAAWSRGQEKIARVPEPNYAPINDNYTPSYLQQNYMQPAKTFTARNGKLGPAIEEPEL